MKNSMLPGIFLILMSLAPCVHADEFDDGELSDADAAGQEQIDRQHNEDRTTLSRKVIATLKRGVFEVVVPKREDTKIQYEKALPVEKIPFAVRNDRYWSVGTAFMIGANKFVSAAHVFDLHLATLLGSTALRDQTGRIYKISRVLKYSQYKDLIEFEVQTPPREANRLPMTEEAEIGQIVYSVGNAQGEGISFRNGQIASFTPEPENGRFKFLRFSAPASPGNSGGPLVNVRGKVVGIITRKNSTENLNYAMKIIDFDSLSNTTAEFEMPIKMHRSKKEFSTTWKAEIPLPATIEKLALAAQKSYSQAELPLVREMYDEGNADFEPANPRFADFARDHYISNGPAFLGDSDGPDRWGFFYPKWTTAGADDGGSVFFFDGNAFRFAVVHRGAGIKSNRYLIANPDYVMNQILRTGFLRRQVGDEGVRITSLGKPEKTGRWKDDLGRTWLSSTWDLRFNNSRVESHCMVTPDGMICELVSWPVAYYRTSTQMLIQKTANSMTSIYNGTVSQWWDYINLEKDLVSPALRNLKIALTNGSRYAVSLDKEELNLADNGFSGNSHMWITMSYAPGKKFAEEPRTLEISPAALADGQQADQWFSIKLHLLHSPTEQSPAWARSTWSGAEKNERPFEPKTEGKFVSVGSVIFPPAEADPTGAINDMNRSLAALGHSSRGPASVAPEPAEKHYERLGIIKCYASQNADGKKTAMRCGTLAKGVKLKN